MENAAKIISIQDRRREEAARRYKEIKATQSALAKEEKELKALLQSWVPENETAVIGSFTVMHECREYSTLDQDALKEIYPELWTEYSKNHKRRTVKVI